VALLQIPTRQDTDNYSVTVRLDGSLYTFSLAWNYRLGIWFMGLTDSAGALVLDGQPVILGESLLHACPSLSKPPGILAAIDTSGTNVEPFVDDLGTRVQLLYQEAGA
jgi:hypothetical protein